MSIVQWYRFHITLAYRSKILNFKPRFFYCRLQTDTMMTLKIVKNLIFNQIQDTLQSYHSILVLRFFLLPLTRSFDKYFTFTHTCVDKRFSVKSKVNIIKLRLTSPDSNELLLLFCEMSTYYNRRKSWWFGPGSHSCINKTEEKIGWYYPKCPRQGKSLPSFICPGQRLTQ